MSTLCNAYQNYAQASAITGIIINMLVGRAAFLTRNSVNSRLSAAQFTGSLRSFYGKYTESNERRPNSHSLWNEARSSKLSEAIFMNC